MPHKGKKKRNMRGSENSKLFGPKSRLAFPWILSLGSVQNPPGSRTSSAISANATTWSNCLGANIECLSASVPLIPLFLFRLTRLTPFSNSVLQESCSNDHGAVELKCDECDECDAWSWNALGFFTGGGSPDVSIVTTVAIDAMRISICEGPARHCCPMFFHMPGQSGAKCEANFKKTRE